MMRALASHQCVQGSIPGPGVVCGLSVVGFLPCSERFFSGHPGFPLSLKTNISLNSNSILECTDISERVLVNSLVLLG